MMEENPSWWSMHSNLRSSTSNDHQQQSSGVSSNMLLSQTHPSLMPTIHYPHDHHHQGQHFPNSWSQLLLGGLAREEEEERYGLNLFQTTKGMSKINLDDDNVKQEEACTNQQNNLIGYHHYEELEVGVDNRGISWSQNMPTSSPKSSCVTSLSSNTNDNSNDNTMLDFSTSKRSLHEDSHQHVDHHSNSECNSTSDDLAEGVSNKKTKVQSLSTPFLKVRKEKLGDRITSLHQLVSPFGKTDTASVLLEAIGYIRFLQGQIEALTSPYLGNDNASAKSQHPEYKDKDLDLKSRGLCLLPLSCTHIVGSDNGADYWATPTLGREF